ncbi:DUF2637 domain-containing protein [Thermostaphylospora chromogena]|uniref:DUF2637 domain-containing protein n=1 Tax=Thermostaphylospora chromogena TaxID=35622 RepID=A0A1H1DYE2_9ACTN|nr:DUF2637 domain-containing protein [Thermostaphylospora chromogena]SDQ81541.1 Protein of unknown function [Thermostaphylospora chromogena]
MDVNPPATGASHRPSAPERPGRLVLALRRTGIALAGLGVATLTAVACVLSFEDLRLLAEQGRARADLSYLYPAGFDALLVVALIAVLLLRGGRWPVRLQAGAVLVLLLAAAVAVETAGALDAPLAARQAAVVVAVAPWVMLVLALWLWLLMIKHVQAGRETSYRDYVPEHDDIVPFQRPDGEPVDERERDRERRRDRPSPDAVSLAAAFPSSSAEAAAPESAVGAKAADAEPARSEPVPAEPGQGTPSSGAEDGSELTESTREETVSERAPDLELRWGDVYKITHPPRREPRDVLVHPLPDGADKPVDSADPAHGPEMADPPLSAPVEIEDDPVTGALEEPPASGDEASATPAERRDRRVGEPVGHVAGPPEAPPSGRMRSTPRPPED